MQLGFYFDQTRCTGCFACAVACKDWHDIPAGPVRWRVVKAFEAGKFPEPFAAFLSESCYHCGLPSCIDACPAGAITKRAEDGIVIVDPEICLGRNICGGACSEACPYQAPQFGDDGEDKMQKCDLCVGRIASGGKPVCVESCPLRALDVAPVEELVCREGAVREAAGFMTAREVMPSVVFKSKTVISRR